MRNILTVIAAMTAILATSVMIAPAQAQQSPEYLRALDIVNRINANRPEQNARHERTKEIISDRVLDSRNRVIGEVRDVVLTRSGGIAMLNVDFDRLRIGADSLAINYQQLGIRPVSNGYKMNYTDDQVVDLVPTLLANIDTASGADADTFSVRKLLGRDVKAANGRTLGKVDDVLFNQLGGRAEYLLVSVNYRSLRGELVAIPFSEPQYQNDSIMVSNAFARAVVDYAKER